MVEYENTFASMHKVYKYCTVYNGKNPFLFFLQGNGQINPKGGFTFGARNRLIICLAPANPTVQKACKCK